MDLEEIKRILESEIENAESNQDSDRYALGLIQGMYFVLELIKGDEDFIRKVREVMK